MRNLCLKIRTIEAEKKFTGSLKKNVAKVI